MSLRDEVLRRGKKIDMYKLVTPIGGGYSAVVWEAEVTKDHLELKEGAPVAIKLYSRAKPEDVFRMGQEFLALFSLDHEHLVRVHDLVIAPARFREAFLVMELVAGKTLKEW